MAGRAEETLEFDEEGQWRTAGDRIQVLLDASAAGGAVARERAEQLVREVVDLYGAGLDRLIRMAVDVDPALADRFAADDLVASLLLVHGLHPHDVHRRVEDALDSVRPYLGSHGGDVDAARGGRQSAGGVVRLQFSGSCKSCPSSAVTLELAVEDAVRAAAPEICSIEVVAAEHDPVAETGTVIPADSLMSRRAFDWTQLGDLASGARPRRSGPRRGRRIPGGRHDSAGLPGRRRPVRLPGPMRQLRRVVGRRRVASPDWARPSVNRSAVPALPRPFRRRPRRRGRRQRRRRHRASRPDPAAGARRRAVDGGPRRHRGGVMTDTNSVTPYDVLARIRANRAPQPAGERCEMCCRADRRRALSMW